MAAVVNLGIIQFGGSSNQVGVYSGQNMQNAWDSHSPNISTSGTMMGQFDVQMQLWLIFNNLMAVGQPIIDPDVKDDASPQIQGP